MSIENAKTIEVYEQYGDKYLARNKTAREHDPQAKADHEYQRQLLKSFLQGFPKNAKIFEIGACSGRDAEHIRSFGYTNILTSDAVNRFVKMLKEAGFPTIKFNLITDAFPDKYDFILCWAVLMHLTKNEAKRSIKKIFAALEPGGRVALCVKRKDGIKSEWADFHGAIGAKRYFSYWSASELKDTLAKTGFINIQISQHDRARACWIECSADKPK